MSRNKQIDEMRKLADEMQKAISDEYCRRVLADERKLEAVLKENGWRKASDVAREIFEDLENTMITYGEVESALYYKQIGYNSFAELKKKYTEGGE